MDPVCIVKRKRKAISSIESLSCFFYISSKGDLRTSTRDRKSRTITVCEERRQLGDTSHVDVQHRLSMIAEDDFYEDEVRWHKSCYTLFSSEIFLGRLRKKVKKSHESSVEACSSLTTSVTSRGSSAMNWMLCMFCQSQIEYKIHRIETMEKSTALITEAKTDLSISVRLAGVSDLIATGGSYHLPCLVIFERRCDKNKLRSGQEKPEFDEFLIKLCRDLSAGLTRSHVYGMKDGWKRFKKLCKKVGAQYPEVISLGEQPFTKKSKDWLYQRQVTCYLSRNQHSYCTLQKRHTFCDQKP